MTKTIHRRLTDLQAHAQAQAHPNAGCETCRGIVLRDDDGNQSRPESCPDCGRVVPIYRELHIVGIPLDLP